MNYTTIALQKLDRLISQKKVRKHIDTVIIGKYSIEVTDYSAGFGGADDRLYTSCEDAREYLPRGCFYVKISTDENVIISRLFNGIRKFGYEDDIYGIHGATVHEYYLTKENGEAFHISAIVFNNSEIIWVGGSKNVHGVVSNDHFIENLQLWKGDRYGFFQEMMTTFYDYIEKSPEQAIQFANYMNDKQYTAIGESCSLKHQHIVKYETDAIRFFAFTEMKPSIQGLTALDPEETIRIFTNFGLYTVTKMMQTSIANIHTRQNIRHIYESEKNSEGAVVYCTDINNNVVHMYKHKNYTYIFARAVREKMRARGNSNVIISRIDNLHIDHPNKKQLLEYYLQFNAWLRIQEKGKIKWSSVFDQWVSFECQFEKIPIDMREKYLQDFDSQQTNQLVLAFISACPGIGKTTIGIALAKLIGGIHISQDGFKPKTARRDFLNKIKETIKNTPTVPIVIDKTNATKQNREDYDFIGPLVWLQFVHPEDSDNDIQNLVKIGMSRIQSRGYGHNTLFPDEKLTGIMKGFSERWEPLTPEESDKSIMHIKIDATDDQNCQLTYLIDQLYYNNIINKQYSQEEINSALEESRLCEETLREQNETRIKTLYWSADVSNDDYVELMQNQIIRNILDTWKHTIMKDSEKISNDFHVTLGYFQKSPQTDTEKELDNYWKIRMNTIIQFKVKAIIYNTKAFAFEIEKEELFVGNEHLHITVGTAPGIQPKYSNELFNAPDKTYINLSASDINKISATVTRHIMI